VQLFFSSDGGMMYFMKGVDFPMHNPQGVSLRLSSHARSCLGIDKKYKRNVVVVAKENRFGI
jgi:hypothetical protein